jgi:hypothetical protein
MESFAENLLGRKYSWLWPMASAQTEADSRVSPVCSSAETPPNERGTPALGGAKASTSKDA